MLNAQHNSILPMIFKKRSAIEKYHSWNNSKTVSTWNHIAREQIESKFCVAAPMVPIFSGFWQKQTNKNTKQREANATKIMKNYIWIFKDVISIVFKEGIGAVQQVSSAYKCTSSCRKGN